MASPSRGSSTTITQIQVDWVALSNVADYGGSPILSYHLQWDAGSNGITFTDLTGLSTESTATTYIVTSGITGGTDYQFKVRAKNLYGWGDYSPIVTIKAAQEPAQVTSITTTVSGLDIIVDWTEPSTNFDPIIQYLIEFRHSDGITFSDDQINFDCDGTDGATVSVSQCIIPF